MEIKILCHCGVKYKFDVEPVNGRMPFAVKCPSCGVDATEFANAHIRQNPGVLEPAPANMAAGVVGAPINLGAANLRIGGQAPAIQIARATPAHPPSPTVPEAPPMAPPVRPMVAAAAQPAKPKRPPSFGLGLLGALLGVIVGCGLWVLVNHFIDTKSKFLILGVGFFAGFAARYLSRDEGSQQLGMIAAALTLAGVFGTQYYMAYQDLFGHSLTAVATELFEEQVAEAKKALAAVPNESDEEIRNYLVSSYNEDLEADEKIDAKSITEEDIKDFREHDLPRYKDLASGKVTATEELKELEEGEKEFKESPGVKLWLVVQGFGVFKLGLLIASCGLAYRMSANA